MKGLRCTTSSLSGFSLSSARRYPSAIWRLLRTGYADGATNMAIDEAISLAVAEGAVPPTIRFYGWQPPCLSIGYAQSMEGEVDVAKCHRHGIDCVRRPTGGRAVLHADELTYSLALPKGDPRAEGGVIESYRRLSLGLVLGLRSLGLPVVQAPEERGEGANSAVCFDLPAPYEITVGGKKLVGSAQVRRKGVVLQHGALPLKGDVARIIDFLRVPEGKRKELKRELRGKATSLELALGRIVTFSEVAEALREGFAQALNLELIPGELTPYELSLAEKLRSEKYGAWKWNFQK